MAICFFPAPGEHSAIRDQGQSVYHGKSVHALRGDDEHEHEYDAFAFLGKTRAKTTAEFDPRADQATHIPFAALTRTPSTSSPQSLTHTHSFPRCKPKMPKKRPSLQSIFIPSFLSPTAAHDASLPPTPISAPLPARVPALSEAPRPAHSRQQSSSSLASSYADSIHHNFSLTPAFDISPNPGPSPPSQDLLPDDPFANLSLSPAAIAFPSILTSPALPPPPPSTPKSPLSPAALDTSPLSRPRPLRTSASTSTLPIKARPAHTRPAFSTRPSLPSLRVLARTSVVMKKKVKKGTPGARLPVEPWNDASQSSRPPSPPSHPVPPSSPSRPVSTASDETMRLSLRPVSRFALDFDSPADTEDFTLALDVDEAGSGSTTPALTFSSCAVSPEAGQTEFAEWGSEGRLAYLCSSEAAQSDDGDQQGEMDSDPEMAGDAARPFEVRACVLAPSSICESSPSNSDSDRMPLPGVPLDTGACPAHASTALYISSSPPALPLPLPQQHSEPDASAHDYYAVRRSGSRSPTTLFWAPRAPEEASDPMIGPQPGLKAADGFIDAEAVAAGQLIGAGVLADPTTSCWGDLRDSSDSCTSPASSATCSVSTSTSTCVSSPRVSSSSPCECESNKPLPPLPTSISTESLPAGIPFPGADDDMPRQYSAHDADAATEVSETGRTEFFDALSDVGSDSTIRGGYVKVGPEALGGYKDRVLGPPGGWPGERASTYGFVHPGERERRGSAATVTGQRLSLTLRRESAVASAHAKRASVSSATPAATFPRTRKVSASVPSPAPRQSAASTSRVSAAPSGSVRRSAASAVCADSVSVASRPVSGSVRDEQRLSRAPERASYAEKERGSNVRDSASLRAAQRNTFGIQSSTPSPRDASSSKLSIAGRESTSRITSATLPAPVPIDTTDKTANNNASSSQPPSPSTLSTGSSSSPPPPIPPRSGRRPGSRAGGAAASDRQKDRAVGIVVGARASSSSASPAGSTPATTPEREKDMPALKRTSHSRSVSRGNAKYFGEVKQDPLASRTPPTNGAVRAFVVSPGDTERGRVSYDSFKANGAGAAGKKNGSAFTGLWQYELEAVDGEDRGGRSGMGGKPDGSGYNSQWSYGGGSAAGRGAGYGRSNGAGAGGRDDDEDGRRRRPGPSSFSDSEDSESSLSDSDDVGDENRTEVTDDDVPLAQSIPTALIAQKTIRRQVKDERKQSRRERLAERHALRHESSYEAPMQRIVDVNQRRAFPGDDDEMEPRGREAARPRRNTTVRAQAVDPSTFPPVAPPPVAGGSRARTKTLPGSTTNPFSVDELTKKLMTVKTSGAPPSSLTRPPSRDAEAGGSGGFFKKLSRPGSRDGENGGGSILSRMRSARNPKDVTAAASNVPARSGTVRASAASRHPSVDREQEQHVAKMPNEERGRAASSSTGYKSGASVVERARSMSRPRAAPPSDLPPPPPVPPVLRQNLQLVQQRVFVGDLQRFHTVEIGPATVAEDVVKMVASQGGLEDLVGSGGWMLWEVAQDFGMDRPIRGFELLQDVFASWNKDKMVNTLMIKRTLLEQILRRSALPSASPICRGYVEYEVKRGKWNKRWLELREHSLYLAKRDNGKDETFLCSLSNFDAYHVTRLHKAPKPYTFAVKSTDNLSFFENTADYVHIFSVPEKEGQMWMEKILLARSYMLIQERTVLMAKSGGLNGTAGSKGLARAPTRKQPPRANQTLVAAPSPAVFEPGSLLAKR